MSKAVIKKGEVVFREGEMGNCFYQIEKGVAGVYIHYGEPDQQKLTEMTAGQFFGEMAVIEAWPRSTTIVAETRLYTVKIDEKNLNEFFKEQPDQILALMQQLGERIRSLTAEYEEVKGFIREKKEAGEKKDGFMAKWKKYRELSALAKKNAGASQEDVITMQNFGKFDAAPTQVISCDKGQIIFREGDTGNYMYAVHGGSVGIYVNYGTVKETKLTTLYSDSFFGEMGLISDEKRSATAVAEENNTTLECIRREELQKIFENNPLKVDMILSHISHQLRRLTRDYMKACAEAAEDN